MSEATRSTQFKVRLSPAEHAALKRHAALQGLKAADIVRQFIRELPEFKDGRPRGEKKAAPR